MQNVLITPKTASDIDKRVEKVLRGLGNPDPPLRLEDVRDLLRLDRAYYTSSDDGVLRETISRLKIAGQQVLMRPSLLLDVIRKLDLKALYLPDRRRILLDSTRPTAKQRWDETHEIGHSLLPWHEEMTLGDDTDTLSFSCHASLEAEANYAAGQLLFLQSQFVRQARDADPSINSVRRLSRNFGNTITTTLWRYVEATPLTPMVGVVSCHPSIRRRPPGFDAANPCRYMVRSPEFLRQFSRISESFVFGEISAYCGSQKGGPLGQDERVLPDDRGDHHVFKFETFFNGYEALTLGVYDRPYAPAFAIPSTW